MSSPARHRDLAPLLLGALACVVACVAVSSQSMWIDEIQTAFKTIPPTLHGWWEALYNEHNSNLQLPLYMLYIWGWARLSGVSELALRAANIPWFFLGFLAIVHFLRRHPRLRTFTLLLYCLHPFVWYYLNEARPYLMQLSGAVIVAGAMFEALEEPGRPLTSSWWWCFGAGLTILCGSGMLGVPWAASITTVLLAQPGFRRSIFRSGLPALILFVPLLVLLALYFAWTLKEKAQPMTNDFSIASIPFVFYEHLGFMGLGPGRSDISPGGFGVFLSYLPSLCILGLPLAYALVRAGIGRFGLSRGHLLAICLTVLLPAAFVFVAGAAKPFRVLGRHLTPLFPFILCAMAYAARCLWERRRLLDRAVVLIIVGALAASALECRFAYRHQRDDNRDATAIARAALASGEDVWWVADMGATRYYQLPASMKAQPGCALILWKPASSDLAGKPPPALIVLSKPDLFDARSGVRQFISQHGYAQVEALPAFTFWKR